MKNGKVNFGDRVEVVSDAFPEDAGKIGVAIAELYSRSRWLIYVIFEEYMSDSPSEIQPSVYDLAVIRIAEGKPS